MLRKSYRVYIPVKSFNKSTSSKQPKSCSSIIGRHETWIAEMHLTVCNENDILTPSNWLSDNHIYACRLIMKSQFPNLEGFTDTLLVSCGKVRNPIKRHEIHIHNQNIKQWVTSAFRNGTLTVYDFLYLNFSASLERQLKAVYLLQVTPHPIKKVVHGQLQSNYKDFGLFPFANCLAIASGIDPASYFNPETN